MDRVNIFGFDFVSMTDYDNLLWELENGVDVEMDELPILITPNVDQIVKYHRVEHKNLFAKMVRAKYVLPDGQPLVWASRLTSHKLKARLTGSDLFPQLWRHSISSKKTVAAVLSSNDLAEVLKKEHPSFHHFVPKFYSVGDVKDHALVAEAAFTMLKTSQPDYLIIGLGFPKQEYLALSLLNKLEEEGIAPPLIFLLGASMEFYARVKKRAPLIYQKFGVEFLHRLLSDPKRMARRYLVDDLAFLGIALREIFSIR